MAHRISNELESKIVELYNSRLELKDISKMCGVHVTTVQRIAKRNNLTRERGKFSSSQKEEICRFYKSGLSESKIASMYNSSIGPISNALKINNIKIRKHNCQVYIKDAVEMYKNGYSLTKICKKYNMNRVNLSNYLKDNGFDVQNFHNIVKFDEHVFDCIDTEKKAYWLGFIYADGSISSWQPGKKPIYNFEVSLKCEDVEHLYKLQDFFQVSINRVKKSIIKLQNGEPYIRYRFILSSKHLWNILNSYGCTPKKSLSLEFPDLNIFKDKLLVRHFIRGYIDGDGSIGFYQNVSLSCLGTKNFLNGLLNFLEPRNLFKNHHSDTTFVFKFSGVKAVAYLYHLYYKSTIYLERKYQIFNKIKDCRFKEKSLKLLESKIGEGWDANTELIADLNGLLQCNA